MNISQPHTPIHGSIYPFSPSPTPYVSLILNYLKNSWYLTREQSRSSTTNNMVENKPSHIKFPTLLRQLVFHTYTLTLTLTSSLVEKGKDIHLLCTFLTFIYISCLLFVGKRERGQTHSYTIYNSSTLFINFLSTKYEGHT